MTTKYNHKQSCLYIDKRYVNIPEIGDFSDFKKWHKNLHQSILTTYMILIICILLFAFQCFYLLYTCVSFDLFD